MTWSQTWDDILSGGNTRWKVTDKKSKQIALGHILDYTKDNVSSGKPLDILCPLSGDDAFVHYAWSCGHQVTAMEMVPSAVAAMKEQFPGNWKEEASSTPKGMTLWKHESDRAEIYQGDVFLKVPGLRSKFDAVYDKDSFGALDPSMRKAFVQRLADYLRPDGLVYTEVKFKKSADRSVGPPFHVEKSDLVEVFETNNLFQYESSLGEVYKIGSPMMKQTGHVLRYMGK